ncbi:MAG: hypothetical protein CM15mV55_140 [uncultured marine virus]|nr:MAG: hypothetical protein CM15mV55_140 [uncultured marine virus]
MTKERNTLGNGKLANGEIISFPKHLTPEIIHSALFISNADDKETAGQRIEYCAKQLGDEAMSYAMALLILPTLMETINTNKRL